MGAALAAGAALALTPAAAHADVFAVVSVQATAPRTDLDLALVNATTGAQQPLPASVNTPANEVRPGISADGRRLVFLRRDPITGTTRVVMVDLETGRAADLFDGFEIVQRPPRDVAITPDGSTVATGGAFDQTGPGTFHPDLTLTDVSGFPAAPFPRDVLRPTVAVDRLGVVSGVAAGGSGLFAIAEQRPGEPTGLILALRGGGSSLPLRQPVTVLSHPTIAASNPQYVVFAGQEVNAGRLLPGDIFFRPASLSTFVRGRPIRLPGVNTGFDEGMPALTPSGRYVAFVRVGAGQNQLFVWDSQTQLLLNPDGVRPGGRGVSSTTSGMAVFERPVFLTLGGVQVNNLVAARLRTSLSVGILVQRVVGFRNLLGRRRPVLRTVGRVPFGPQRAGRVRIRWDGRVNGRLLRPGVYQITVRALDRRGRVRDLGAAALVRLDARGRVTKVVRRG